MRLVSHSQAQVSAANFLVTAEVCVVMQDAKLVLAYAPQQALDHSKCAWPWAHALHSMALEGLHVSHALSCQLGCHVPCMHVLLLYKSKHWLMLAYC